MKHIFLRFGFVLVVVFIAGGAFLWAIYAEGHRSAAPSTLDEVARALAEEENAESVRVSEDSAGGASPVDVLQKYASAVERRADAEAASYFILDRRVAEQSRLASSSDVARNALLGFLREASQSTGTYSRAGDAYTIRTPIFIDFLRYPNGLWKLVEL